MYEKDYILRMIEMLGELLRAIFGLIVKGEYDQAGRELNEAYLTMLRKDAAFFRRIPAKELTKTLITEHNLTNSHLEVLAELLLAEASLLHARNNKDESLSCFKKSLILFEFVNKAYRTYSADRIEKIRSIRERISEIKSYKNQQ
jgi:hypothetical protein